MSAGERSSASTADDQVAEPVGSSSRGSSEVNGAPAKVLGKERRRRRKKETIVDPAFEDAKIEWFRAHPASPFLSAGVGFGLLTAFLLKEVRREDRREGHSVLETVQGAVGLSAIAYGLLVLATVLMYVVWRNRYWALTDVYVLEKSGVFSASRRKAAIASIDAVDVTRNTVAKIFGFSVVTVRFPDSETFEFRYLRAAAADQLRRRLLEALEASERVDSAQTDGAVGEEPLHKPASDSDANLGDEPTESVEPNTDNNDKHWVGGKPRRERVDFLALDREEAIVYDLPVRRSVEAQAWRAGIGAVIVAGILMILAVPVVIVLARFDFSISAYAGGIFAGLASINVVLMFAGGLYAAFRAATKYYASKVRVVPGAFGISRGLLKEFSSTLYTTRVHWVEVSQPFAWRWPGLWRLRVRTVSVIDYDDDDDSEDDNAKPNELVLPVATLDEVGKILDLLAQYTNINSVDALSVASRSRPLTATTSRRARFFSPFVHGHEGYLLNDSVLYARTGRWTTALVAIPLKNIQHTGLEQGVLQRFLGLGDVVINGALSAGSYLIENLDEYVAEELFAELRERTRTPQH